MKVDEAHDGRWNWSELSDVLRQRDRTRALRRQSVMRARRESGTGLEHHHQHHHHHADDAEDNPDENDEDEENEEQEDEGENPVNGVGTGTMRYQYMTPEDFGDEIEMRSMDILKAFKGLSSTHGIPHVSDARGNRRSCKIPK